MRFIHEGSEYILRAIEPEDVEFLYQIENDDMLWGVSATNVPYSKQVLRDYIVNSQNDIFVDGQVRLIIAKADGTNIGVADLMNFDPRHLRSELGLVLRKEYRSQGIGEAAARKLCNYAHEVLHLHQVYAVVGLHNAECLTCLKRVGFEERAILTDWLYNGETYLDAVMMQYFL